MLLVMGAALGGCPPLGLDQSRPERSSIFAPIVCLSGYRVGRSRGMARDHDICCRQESPELETAVISSTACPAPHDAPHFLQRSGIRTVAQSHDARVEVRCRRNQLGGGNIVYCEML